MKKILSLLFLTTGLMLSSCSDETINIEPQDFIKPADIYTSRTRTLQYVNNLYLFVPKGYNRLAPNAANNDDVSGAGPVNPAAGALTSMVAAATDEAVHTTRNSASEQWGTGIWSAAPNTNWDNVFKKMYAGIRRTHIYTEDINPNIVIGTGSDQLDALGKNQYLGQVLFLRALFNFELLKRYGGYPIVKKKLSADEDLNLPKNTYDECVQYIASLCDEAQALLPPTWAAGELGRATKGAALALKGRLLLYAASPLNNSAGTVAKWEAAAEANNAVIKLNVYSLFSSYENFFITLVGNNEIILSSMETNSNTYERVNGLPSLTGGLGGTTPTWDLVSDYEMSNGTPFDWTNPAHKAAPFANRDPRLAQSILFNGSSWMGTTVDVFDGGKDKTPLLATRTGFYLRKLLSTSARFTGTAGTSPHCFPLFRYAETLLNYAEAMNEAYGPNADPKGYGLTARQAIRLVRVRAGLTANQDVATAATQAQFRAAVRHERRIELAFEEHRHMDLRRWKIAETVLNQPVSGLKVVKNGTTFTYTPEIVEQRKFDASKMYLYPFPQDEIGRNPNLTQNPGW